MAGEIDGYISELVEQGRTPGIQYACVDSAGAIRSHCAGWADLHWRRPMSEQTAMMAYSMSKVLTAYSVTILEHEGHFRIDDLVTRYLPNQPYGPSITIRHLLEHRSGVPNPIPLRWVHLAANHECFDESAALEAVLQRHARLKFAPGTKLLYSNLGYWLLGRLVERVAGQPFVAFVEEKLLRPLGIGPAEIGYRFPANGSQAHGYLERYSLLNLARPFVTAKEISGEYEGRWLRIQDHYVNGPAFGGCIGTAAGFCKFARHLLESGDRGFGWSERPTFVQKEGGGAGFHCMLRLDWRNQRASVVMSNATGLNVSVCLDRIEGFYRK